jgi:hypothetical protein
MGWEASSGRTTPDVAVVAALVLKLRERRREATAPS